ncbi:TetR/AcrR family transcriptional regulator [Asticcacaulis sp. DW145]|uniref:TetR/AcrR family transcriptional regulator n=1 Tax=Asticcacaulis sp. DW145 TaxID=3095608 RepID=UPI00308AD63B|nr:TetR/AcrR family transcriptional regulator [Asticcacaulis sp. DW145]
MLPEKDGLATSKDGLRERKRRETLQRITEVGMGLFLQKGYEATTLDEIAAAAGISRRTFFYYFKSKDDILLSLQNEMGDVIVTSLKTQTLDRRPLDAVRDAVIAVCSRFPTDEMMAIDELMRSSPAVQARKQASYVQHEDDLFQALRERWPDPQRETGLRLVAMLSMGAIRLSFEALKRENGARPIADLLREAFNALKAEI